MAKNTVQLNVQYLGNNGSQWLDVYVLFIIFSLFNDTCEKLRKFVKRHSTEICFVLLHWFHNNKILRDEFKETQRDEF